MADLKAPGTTSGTIGGITDVRRAGYALVAINPRGSTGYGQKFTDQISQDWTGRVYEDLIKGLEYALQKYSFLDGSRVAAAGGSYGGFMVNWLAGHTDRFKALISHAGVFDLTSKYGTTRSSGSRVGVRRTPLGKTRALPRALSQRLCRNFKTPTLVIHGALDFRVPDAQAWVCSRHFSAGGAEPLCLVPDEGHWILRLRTESCGGTRSWAGWTSTSSTETT